MKTVVLTILVVVVGIAGGIYGWAWVMDFSDYVDAVRDSGASRVTMAGWRTLFVLSVLAWMAWALWFAALPPLLDEWRRARAQKKSGTR